METTNEYLRMLRDYKTKHAADYGIERIGIFGSVARGEQTEKSDVDVYFESDTISLFRMGGLLRELENLFGTRVDIVRNHPYLRPRFRQRIEKEVIYV